MIIKVSDAPSSDSPSAKDQDIWDGQICLDSHQEDLFIWDEEREKRCTIWLDSQGDWKRARQFIRSTEGLKTLIETVASILSHRMSSDQDWTASNIKESEMCRRVADASSASFTYFCRKVAQTHSGV
jgi:hypothetical protein